VSLGFNGVESAALAYLECSGIGQPRLRLSAGVVRSVVGTDRPT
jgi:hypothetical protein